MSETLKAGRFGPDQGEGTALLVLLHGYGANGDDLLSLAPMLAPELPGWVFLAPDAPDPCPGAPGGRQWSPIPWLDGSDPILAQTAFLRSVALVNGFLDTALDAERVPPDRCVLLGFSQGAMLSLQLAPRRAPALGGVIAASGRLLLPDQLDAQTVSRPPVLLLHGDRDDVVPPAALPEAAKALKAAGFRVYAHLSEGIGHGIAPDGLGVALQFLRQVTDPGSQDSS